MIHSDLPFAFLALFLFLVAPASSQQVIAIPGSPKGDLPTELLQCRTYCRSMERSMQSLEKQFPSLGAEILAANASWKSSPFAGGCEAIEDDFIKDAGEKGKEILKKLDDDTWAEAAKYIQLKSEAEARDFLALVDRRAKGGIEVEMVRGNLLWQYKPFQDTPEMEFARGYVQKITHTASTDRNVVFEVPMSWKSEKTPKTELMSFRNCYGHGNVWMTVLVSPTVDERGQTVTAQEKFDAYSQEALRVEYLRLGIVLTSFSKTKVNGMPAVIFTREQPFEQLGQKATRAAQVIRAFSGSEMISFQINTLGPIDDNKGVDRIKKNEALFKMIGGSLRVIDR